MNYSDASRKIEYTGEKFVDITIDRDYIADMSHSYKTPISILSSALELLRSKIILSTEGNDEYLRIISTAQSACNKLTALTDNMIALTMMEAKSLRVKLVECDLSELVRKTVESSMPVAWGKKVNLSYTVKNNPENAICDEGIVERILYNLISNAIKYNKKGGSVEICLRELDDFYEISVKDTGIGISRARQKELFKKRGVSRLKEQGGGYGIGLRMVHSYVRMLGGEIWVETELGVGSIFSFTLAKPCGTIPLNLIREPEQKIISQKPVYFLSQVEKSKEG